MKKKTTMQIAMETMERIAKNNKTDNNINHLSRYISDVVTHNNNELSDMVKEQIEKPVVYLAVNIVKSRLRQIQLRTNRTYSDHNWNVLNALSVMYDTGKIDPYVLYFRGIKNPVRADRQTDNKLYKRSDYNSYNICCDMVSECVLNIYNLISDMVNNNQPVDLLTPYIVPYDTMDENGIERPVKKWKYKSVNAIRIAADAVEKTFSDYKSTVLLDDVLTDSTGCVSVIPLSAISDTVGDVTINDELIELFDQWVAKYGIDVYDAQLLKLHYLYKFTVEQISQKINATVDSVKSSIKRARAKISDNIAIENPKSIMDTIGGKKIIVLFDSLGKRECSYTSISECARDLNVSRAAVQKALKAPRIATCKGYTMDYMTI